MMRFSQLRLEEACSEWASLDLETLLGKPLSFFPVPILTPPRWPSFRESEVVVLGVLFSEGFQGISKRLVMAGNLPLCRVGLFFAPPPTDSFRPPVPGDELAFYTGAQAIFPTARSLAIAAHFPALWMLVLFLRLHGADFFGPL